MSCARYASSLAPPPPSHSVAHAPEAGRFRYYVSEAAGFRYCHDASLFAFSVILVPDIICLRFLVPFVPPSFLVSFDTRSFPIPFVPLAFWYHLSPLAFWYHLPS